MADGATCYLCGDRVPACDADPLAPLPGATPRRLCAEHVRVTLQWYAAWFRATYSSLCTVTQVDRFRRKHGLPAEWQPDDHGPIVLDW